MKSILVLLSFLSSGYLLAQQEFDNRLLANFSEESILKLESTNPEILDYWTYFLDKGYQIIDSSSNKAYNIKGSLRIKQSKLEEINLFELGLPHPLSTPDFYEIENSDLILVLIPREQIQKKYARLNSQNTLR